MEIPPPEVCLPEGDFCVTYRNLSHCTWFFCESSGRQSSASSSGSIRFWRMSSRFFFAVSKILFPAHKRIVRPAKRDKLLADLIHVAQPALLSYPAARNLSAASFIVMGSLFPGGGTMSSDNRRCGIKSSCPLHEDLSEMTGPRVSSNSQTSFHPIFFPQASYGVTAHLMQPSSRFSNT